jgi:ribose/xylose/arabinose/galactoside ABC-type transport system permease subunit
VNQPDVTKAGEPSPAASPFARIRAPADLPARLRRAAIVFPFLILFVVLSVASGPFFTKVNLLDILDQQAATLIIAAAGTLVLVAGGIDGFDLLGLNPLYEQITLGAILLIAVGIDAWSRLRTA